ncbi:MAG TPA: hypothetical protein VFW49_16280 [Fluviicoccus sp.]|nr:hypothetical protein [Fluviicoccus sp.]
MALRHFLYGDHEPTPVHQIMTGIILVSFLLAVYGLSADFIPDQGWVQGGGFFSLSLLAILIIGAKAIEDNDGTQRFYVSSKGTFETLLAGGIRSCFYLCVLWLAFVHGFASLYTGTFGHRYESEFLATKQTSSLSFACDYQVTATEVQSGATQYLCISYRQYLQWPDSLMLRMDGRSSMLGKTVTSLTEVETPLTPEH